MTLPGNKLVGQNASLDEGVYSDDYLRELNKTLTVDEVFGEQKEAIAAGERGPVARIIMDTLGQIEYELHLVSIVMTAAKAGEWRAVRREEGKHIHGLDVVVDKGFGYVVKHEDKTFLLPSLSYVEHCQREL